MKKNLIMIVTFDQIGKKIEFHRVPVRIVSLVPSITELLFDLKLGENIVGITKFCVEPKGFVENIPKVGGTKKIDISLILTLQPDIVVANKEENEKEQILELQKYVPVWVSNVENFDDSLDLIQRLGIIFKKEQVAKTLIEQILIKKELFLNKIKKSKFYNKSVLYFIWRKPYMVAGKQTFIGSILKLCCLRNLGEEIQTNSRYPTVNENILTKLNPDLIFLSTEPYPFKEKHIPEFQQLFPSSEIYIVRGDFFSWYGSRLLKSFDYFFQLFNLA